MSFCASRFKLGSRAAAAEDPQGPGDLGELPGEDVPQQLQVAAQPSQQRNRLATKLDGFVGSPPNILYNTYNINNYMISWPPLVGC